MLYVFDLDETIINSSHRTPNHPDGTLNLEAYKRLHTPENVAKDTLLPLVETLRRLYSEGHYIAILTARDMKDCDYQFLQDHNIPYHKIMSRDQCKTLEHYQMRDGDYKRRWLQPLLNLKQFKSAVMFDDAAPVKTTLRKYLPVLCARRVNERLA